jgi:hypothetical protein
VAGTAQRSRLRYRVVALRASHPAAIDVVQVAREVTDDHAASENFWTIVRHDRIKAAAIPINHQALHLEVAVVLTR